MADPTPPQPESRHERPAQTPRQNSPSADAAPAVSPEMADRIASAREQFISLWGQMGSAWGIPRTMAQVHALLMVHGRPMNTDDVMDALAISRGNASQTLRRLVDWGIVHRVHRKGDRKEYFGAEGDVWKMFRTILAQRKKREIDPLIESLVECRELTELPDGGRRIAPNALEVQAHNERLDELIGFIQIVNAISERFISPQGEGLERAAKLLGRAS